MAFPLVPLLLLGGGAAFLFMAPKAAAGGTIGPPQKIPAPVGSRFTIDFTATNIPPRQLEQDLIASMKDKGNVLSQFTVLGHERYRIVVDYGTSGLISLNLPVETENVFGTKTVITTTSARRDA
jgi:hypothetical protein